MEENKILSGFEKAELISQILQFEGKEIFKATFASPERARTKVKRKLLDFWKIRKKQVISAVEANQPVPKLKTPQIDEKTDFWEKSKLKARKKVAVRNANRNKLTKKYGLFAHKHKRINHKAQSGDGSPQ